MTNLRTLLIIVSICVTPFAEAARRLTVGCHEVVVSGSGRRWKETVAGPRFADAKIGEGSHKVVVFGDSLSQQGAGRGVWTSLSYRYGIGGWPNSTDLSLGSEQTLFNLAADYLEDANRISVTNKARSGAYVDPARNQSGWFKRVIWKTDDFQAQVDSLFDDVERGAPFPNVVLSFIGHNNLDWKWDVDHFKLNEELYLSGLPITIARAYEEQIRRLISKANEQNYAVELVVVGLIHLPSGLDARDFAGYLFENEGRYPHFDMIAKNFPSLLPEYRIETENLWRKINAGLEEMARRLNIQHAHTNVRIRYCPAVAEASFGDLKYLDHEDAWHPSPRGRGRIADLIFHWLIANRIIAP